MRYDRLPISKSSYIDRDPDLYWIDRCRTDTPTDFIIDASCDKLYFNEIDTLPISLSFYLWVKSNPPLVYTELLNRIVRQAEKR